MLLDGKIPGLEKGTPMNHHSLLCNREVGPAQAEARLHQSMSSTHALTYRTRRALLFSPRDASLHFWLLPCAGSQTHQRGAGVGDSARERRKRWAAHCTGTRTAQLLRQSHMIPSFLSSGAGEKSSIELEWKDAVCRSRNRN